MYVKYDGGAFTITDTYREEDKVFLIIFADAVINPRAMVVHFSNASPADTVKEKKNMVIK